MQILDVISNVWSIVEILAFSIVFILFFMDPIRRWNFFGYRPTAIMALFDDKAGKVLLLKKDVEPWYCFSQGGIYNPDLNFSSKEILKRELGLDENKFSLRYTQTLGKVRIRDREYNKRARISTISMMRNLRGKGYIACYIRTNFDHIDKAVNLGEDICEFKIVSIAEARKLILGQGAADQQVSKSLNKKQQYLMKALDEIERICAKAAQQKAKCRPKSPDQPTGQPA